MKSKIKIHTITLRLLVFAIILMSCGKSSGVKPTKDTIPKEPEQNILYRNPVFKPILADPTVFKDPNSEYFYAYGTEDYWSTDGKNHLVAVVRSKDLINWTFVGDAFLIKPTWKANGGIWAPDIQYINGQYYLYYSYSIWADPNPGIGLAIATNPEGPFVDQGKMFYSNEFGGKNCIDPFYFEENNKKYLFVGSYNNDPGNGTYGVELSADAKSVPDYSKKFRIAAGDFEATVIHKRGSYYYFFGSKNNCCDGANSIYQVRVARSKSLHGPYLDKNGNDIAHAGNGSLVLQRNSTFAGPGHNSAIITDKDGVDWILYHAMDTKNAMIGTVNQRALMLDKVNWDADGWPLINNGYPSSQSASKPNF